MLRSLRSCSAVTPDLRRRRPIRRPIRLHVGFGSCLVLAAAVVGHAAPFDTYAQPSGDLGGAHDGLSSVIVGGPAESGSDDMSSVGGGWGITDANDGSGMMLESHAGCPNGDCPGSTCPPWNGVPGLINRHLGDTCPRLVWSVDALMLWQGNVASVPLFIDSGSGLAALNVNQLNSPVSVGPRVGLILNLTQCHAIEANWFDVQTFAASRELDAGASQYAMDNIAGMTFADIDTALISQTAAFKSFELNWRRRTGSPFTWIAGFRWVEWDQTLDIVDTYTDATPASGVDAASVVTGNNLYGGQLGVDALLWNSGRWLTVNGVAKAGVYYNYQAFQRTDLFGDREFGAFSAAENGTAFLGDVGINGTVQILTWLYWRAGYNFFWLSGVAVPASQLSSTNQPDPPTTSIDRSGSVFLHGVNTGLEARW